MLVFALGGGLPLTHAADAPDLSPQQTLGRRLFTDTRLSLHDNLSCAGCHGLSASQAAGWQRLGIAGFADPRNVDTGSAVSTASAPGRHGHLNAPGLAYAAYIPPLRFDTRKRRWTGGLFWNGRASSLEDQATEPLFNAEELALPDPEALLRRLQTDSFYVQMFRRLYDLDISPAATAQPVSDLSPRLLAAVGSALARFERSALFQPFTAKFDFVLAGLSEFSPEESQGFALFKGKAKCARCHSVTATGGGKDLKPPLFTDYSYANIGIPQNKFIPGNPPTDVGLFAVTGNPQDRGKHRVMTLRNVALTPPYGHNGFFANLREIIYFYNTRDQTPQGWGAAEFPQTVNRNDTGDLRLTGEEEQALLAFLQTLTDGYPQWGGDPAIPAPTPSPYAQPAL